MDKKIILTIIISVSLTAGFFYWQTNKQSAAENPGTQTDNQLTEKQPVEKNLVEIFYLPHGPALAVVDKIDPIIAKFPDFKVVKYNFDEPANKNIIAGYNLINHYPVAIFIGSENSFTVDGKKISLVNFPKGDAFIPSFEGEWTYEDLE